MKYIGTLSANINGIKTNEVTSFISPKSTDANNATQRIIIVSWKVIIKAISITSLNEASSYAVFVLFILYITKQTTGKTAVAKTRISFAVDDQFTILDKVKFIISISTNKTRYHIKEE